MAYRNLTDPEIKALQANGCWAEDWTRIEVSEDFMPNFFHRVMFYGDIRLGTFTNNVEVSRGFMKHSGINNATLRNVTIGNNCLIENISGFINNYVIGDDCIITNVCTMETTDGATYGEGNLISVLNEVGDGNLILFRGLTSQVAALMVKHFQNRPLKDAIRRLVREEIERTSPETATIGNRVKIVNTKEITNTVIYDDCEISGAARLSDCTLMSNRDASVYIGTGVICENSIISDGSSIINSVKMQDCYVGEACQLSNGFTAASSVFFANSYMSNGEACAAFCGPFTASHHKSSLLIGGQFSFYNAGSATNFSNHAYKMGPMHYGTLERGTKTASGAYILMPAHIGAFSVCFGKLMYHPDTRSLPFSYLIAYNDVMYLVPGRNLTTVGLYRDIRKWPKRDKRLAGARKSVVNFDWLSPFTVGEILRGKKILEDLREASGEDVQPVGDNATTMTTDSGVTLPAGVLPPNNPPEPGDAPLGPDGHYNYDAPEFVLTNPCDDPEIMGRLDRLGFREQTYMEGRIEGNKQIGCVIESDASGLLSIWHAAVAHSQLERYSAEPLAHHEGIFNWVTFTQTEPLGSSACIASVETEQGALGFVIDTTGQDSPDPQHRLCAPVNELLIDYLGEES